MSDLETHLRVIARNNLWSNCRLHRACAQLSPEACAEDRTTLSTTSNPESKSATTAV